MFKFELIGHALLLRKLERLKPRRQNALLRQSVLAGMRIAAKAIKQQVPSAWKEGRKAIGAKAQKESTTGQLFGKVGVSVGMKKSKAEKIKAKAKARGKKPGVGLAISNFHWFVAGTEKRYQTTTGRYTGKMRKTPIVRDGWNKSKSAVRTAMIANLRKGLEKEAAKG